MDKVKLSYDEQINDLKEKNVKFEKYGEEDAKKFLQYNNYYFKLKSYARNYTKYSKVELADKYINLDFACLVELSTLDMYLRRVIVTLCLDIEHILKTRLMRDVTNNDSEDGYKDKSSTADLIRKFEENEDTIPIWSFIETLSFGRFIELYELYYGVYGGILIHHI